MSDRAREPEVIVKLCCGADGVLLTAYEHLKAVKRDFELRTRQSELAQVRARAENLRVPLLWQPPLADDEGAAMES